MSSTLRQVRSGPKAQAGYLLEALLSKLQRLTGDVYFVIEQLCIFMRYTSWHPAGPAATALRPSAVLGSARVLMMSKPSACSFVSHSVVASMSFVEASLIKGQINRIVQHRTGFAD